MNRKELLEFLFKNWFDNFKFPIVAVDRTFHIERANTYAKKHLCKKGKEEFDNNISKLIDIYFIPFLEELEKTDFIEDTVDLGELGKRIILGFKLDKEGTLFLLLFLPDYIFNEYNYFKRLCESIIENISNGIIILDEKFNIQRTNIAFTKITGYEEIEVIDRKPFFLDIFDETNLIKEEILIEVEEKGKFKGIIKATTKAGDILECEVTIFNLLDKYYNIKNWIIILYNVTELLRLRKEVEKTRLKDPLTGLLNRASFLNILDIKVQMATPQSPVALLFIDLNKFKQVNDTYGHKYGDYVLVTVANRMKSVLRKNDIICRYGGDEFLVLLEGVNEETAYKIALKIEKEVSKPYVLNNMKIDFISASIGIAFAPNDAKTPEELLEKADKAMYEAKRSSSKHKIMFASQIVITEEKRSIKTELLNAMEKDEFYIRIQPIVCTKTKKITGGEILARWISLTFDEVPPSIFIPLLEQLGKNKEFDIYILEKTLKELEKYKHSLEDLSIHVNFSADSFYDDEFIQKLKDISEHKPWAKKHLVVEITESTMMANIEKSVKNIKTIKKLGFKLAIDDFGTGFSSLSYIKYFPIDYIKIDKSFIDNIETDEKDKKIVKTIITLAYAIGAETIAEGIETKEQYEILKENGVEYIQGFYFYKPLLPPAFFKKLKETVSNQ